MLALLQWKRLHITAMLPKLQVLVSDCRFGVSPVNYPDPDPVTLRI